MLSEQIINKIILIMAKNCGIRDCKDPPEFFCECTTSSYYCVKHCTTHIKQIGEAHNFNPLFISVDDEIKDKLIQSLNENSQLLVKTKNEMNKRCNEIIEFTIKSYKNAIQKIADEQKYYNTIKKRIIEKSEIDKEVHERGFFSSRSVAYFVYNLELIQKETSSYFSYSFEHCSDDGACFWLEGQYLHKIYLNSLQRSAQPVSFNFGTSYNNTCKLSDDKFFVQACHSVFIIELASNTITPLMEKGSIISAIGCISDVVYIINTGESAAYSILTRQWSNLSPLPRVAHPHCSGGPVSNKICITNHAEEYAYIYDPNTNQYTAQMKLPNSGWKPVGHGYILTTSCMYQMQENDTNKWKIIEYANLNAYLGIVAGVSYLFKRGNYLYAVHHGFKNICQIDTQLFQAKQLIF